MYRIVKGDLPEDFLITATIAIDTETMGLLPHRDRLCLVQVANSQGDTVLVQIPKNHPIDHSPRLVAMLENDDVLKIFHFARFDVMMLQKYFRCRVHGVFCTKIASKLTRTFTSRHGLKDICKELLGVDISKQEQTSDWGQETLTPEQLKYAAQDVIYLHQLHDKFTELLNRENRLELAQACFKFLPYRAELDVLTTETYDIFSHQAQ